MPNLDLTFFIDSAAISDLKFTTTRELFGTSIPISDLPGIGASILTEPVGDASAKAKSYCKLAIFVIFVPDEVSSAYWVTEGPKFTSATLTVIPNELNVSSIILIRTFT